MWIAQGFPYLRCQVGFSNGARRRLSDLCTVRTVGTNLSISVMNLWQQSKAKVDRLLRNPPPVVSRTHEITCPLPHEIAEMIIAHLIHDLRALKAYSLTCRSWYIVAVPHIHRTLVLGRSFPHDGLEPLSRLHRLGLIPLVQEIRVERLRGVDNWFVPQAFGRSRLRHFSTFANVHTLGLQRVEIFHFFPHVERYFGQFSPTLRSIVLSDLRCTPRQLSHFLSLFPNLDDIKICGLFTYVPNTTVPDTTPIPFSTPELRGCLSLGWFSYVETWTHLITSCGGLRFHRMELWESARCVSALLEACAETLEILRFHATDRSRSKSTCIHTRIRTDGEQDFTPWRFPDTTYHNLRPSDLYKSWTGCPNKTSTIRSSWRRSRRSHPTSSPSLLLSSRVL